MADYKIGVEIALAGSILQGLEAISAKLLGINAKVKDVEGGFSRWALAIGGAAALMGSEKLVQGLEKVTKAGGELVKQQTLLQNLIQDPAGVASTTAAAQLATMKIMGTTIAENIAGMREMIGVTSTLEEAQKLYVPTMRGAKVLESLTGAPADKNMQILAKAIEQLGGGTDPKTQQIDPERFERYMKEAVKTIVASGGLIDANALLGFAKQAGPMARMETDPARLFQSYMTAIMDMGGYRAGTALTAAGRQLLGGKMSKPTADEMSRMGLLVDGKWHKSGTGVTVDPGGLVGEDLLKGSDADVAKWFNTVLKKALVDHGMTNPADLNQELYKVLGTETTRRIAGLFLQNSGQIDRDAALQRGVDADKAYTNLYNGDYEANMKNMESAWTSLMQAVGAPLVKPAIEAMHVVADAINSLAGSALAHPELMKAIGEGAVGLAAAMAVFGGAAIGSALLALAPAGAVIVGIGAFVAAIAGVAALNWEAITKGFSAGVTMAGEAVQKVGKALSDAIAGIPAMVMGAISSMASGIASAISNALAGALHSLVPGTGGSHPDYTAPDMPFSPGAYHAPAGTSAPIHVHTALNVDGRQLAESTSVHTARMYEHPSSAPTTDSYRGYAAPDYNYATG